MKKLTELLLTAENVAEEEGFFNCHKSRPKAELIAVEDIKTAWLINHINHIYGRKKKRRVRKQ